MRGYETSLGDKEAGIIGGTAAERFEAGHKIRTFETGATRDKEDHKNDYEGFFSPLVFRRYGDYMQKHRLQKDGSVRDSDNWQKGMGLATYMKSKWRHFMDIWTIQRGYKAVDFDGVEVDLEDALCADLFNTMGYLHEVLKGKLEDEKAQGKYFAELSRNFESKTNIKSVYPPQMPKTYAQPPTHYTSHCPNCSRVAAECICCKGPSECEPTKE